MKGENSNFLFWIAIVVFIIGLLFLWGARRPIQEFAIRLLLYKTESLVIQDGEYEIRIERKKQPEIKLSITEVLLINPSSRDKISVLTPGTESIIRVNYEHIGRYPKNLKMTCKPAKPNDCSLQSKAVFTEDEIDKWFTFKDEKSIHELIDKSEKIELTIAVDKEALTGDLCLKIQFVDGKTGEILTTKTQDFHVIVE